MLDSDDFVFVPSGKSSELRHEWDEVCDNVDYIVSLVLLDRTSISLIFNAKLFVGLGIRYDLSVFNDRQETGVNIG